MLRFYGVHANVLSPGVFIEKTTRSIIMRVYRCVEQMDNKIINWGVLFTDLCQVVRDTALFICHHCGNHRSGGWVMMSFKGGLKESNVCKA